jgi:hypothetical protein
MSRWWAGLVCGVLLPTAAHTQATDSVALAVAVFRTAALHGQLASHAGAVPQVICLANAIKRPPGDAGPRYVAPDSAVVARVREHIPTAVSMSECTIEPLRGARDHTSLVVHPSTGRRGIVVWMEPLARDTTGALAVNIGYHENGLSAGWWTCAVRRINSEWVVNACRLLGMA